jgi:signal transduction histidine kinase/CheY-like chemotaxis protein
MWACLALAAAAAVVFWGCDRMDGAAEMFPSHEIPPYATYRDIPGVTDSEIVAIEALREKYRDSVFVYGVMESVESFIGQDSKVNGFTALVCDFMSKLFGINVKSAIFEWNDLIAGLESGAIHFSGDLTPTEKRRETYFMTSAMINRTIMYYRLEDSEPLAKIAGTRPLRFGFFEGTTTVDVVLAHSIEDVEVFFADDYNDAYAMLREGRIDAFLEENAARSIFDAFGGIVHDVFLPLIYEPIALTTQIEELAPIISVVDKFLQSGGLRYFAHMYRTGEHKYAAHRVLTTLTEDEKTFVSNRPTVLFVAEYDNYPLSFYNVNEKKWQGIAFDVLHEVALLTGITFKVINDERTKFAELVRMLENGEASIITELIRSKDRKGRFLWPNTPILSNRYALVTRSDYPSISVNEVLSLKVGVQEGTAYSELFKRWFPDHQKITEYPNNEELFNALGDGKIDVAMSSQVLLLTITNYMERPGYKVNVLFDYSFESTFGFNKNDSLLCSIVDKALQHIDIKNIADIWLYKTYDYRIKLMQSRIPFLISLSVLLLCVVALLLILFHRNRTMGKRLERLVEERSRDLAEALEDAKVASRAKSVFLANMSHEIRTPMNSVIGFAEIALDYDMPDMPRECVGKILENSKWLLQIINDILDVSKIEAGRVTLENIPFALCDIFSHCQTIAVPRAAEKGIGLHFYAEPFIGKKLVGDPTKLAQVFINLISNAIKFTNIGTVKISSTIVEKSDNSIRFHFEVKDSGIGMTPDEIRRIFEPFAQANESITRKFGGTGLGLPIIKTYIELMGGKLSVESAPDIGSKFGFDMTFDMIDVPADNTDGNIGIKTEPVEKPVFTGEVLVCEDNGMNQEIIRRHLERVGLQIVIADNGKIGIDMVKNRLESGKRLFDLILMDINMPVMDGIEASANILELNTGIPIVAMTANVMPNDRNHYEKSGMRDCIGKPFTSQELWRCLLKYLKPVSGGVFQKSEEPETIAAGTEEESIYDSDLLLELRTHFVNDNQNRFAEFADALENNDIKLAHRIAHTLKGNAATIGKSALEQAACNAELALSGGENQVTKKEMDILAAELSNVLKELSPLLVKESDSDNTQLSVTLNSLPFLDELGNLLRKGSSNSLKYINALRSVVGCERLIRQIENFDFDDAFLTFTALRESEEGTA